MYPLLISLNPFGTKKKVSTANPVELGEDASSVLLHGAHWASIMKERQGQGVTWGVGVSRGINAIPGTAD